MKDEYNSGKKFQKQSKRQMRLFDEAKKNPERVIPNMFFEDCVKCESHAIRRLNNGYYNYFYATLPSISEATIDEEGLPSNLQSVTDSNPEQYETRLSWDMNFLHKVGGDLDGEYPITGCISLLWYDSEDDIYIHASGSKSELQIHDDVLLYVYDQRVDEMFDTFQPWDAVRMWLYGWILESEGFYDPEQKLPMGMLKYAEGIDSESRYTALHWAIQDFLPEALKEDISVRTPTPSNVHKKIEFYRYDYRERRKEFSHKLPHWQDLFLGKSDQTECERDQCDFCNR